MFQIDNYINQFMKKYNNTEDIPRLCVVIIEAWVEAVLNDLT